MAATRMDSTEPTRQERRKAAEAAERLADGRLELSQLPDIAIQLLAQVLEELAKGRALAIVHVESDMTTNEAAEYLNVSRPYLVRLLDDGKIPFHRVGSHKRISFEAAKRYKEEQKKRSYAALAELQAEAQELNMGYDIP
jgi:excisionase family DNA binding protein